MSSAPMDPYFPPSPGFFDRLLSTDDFYSTPKSAEFPDADARKFLEEGLDWSSVLEAQLLQTEGAAAATLPVAPVAETPDDDDSACVRFLKIRNPAQHFHPYARHSREPEFPPPVSADLGNLKRTQHNNGQDEKYNRAVDFVNCGDPMSAFEVMLELIAEHASYVVRKHLEFLRGRPHKDKLAPRISRDKGFLRALGTGALALDILCCASDVVVDAGLLSKIRSAFAPRSSTRIPNNLDSRWLFNDLLDVECPTTAQVDQRWNALVPASLQIELKVQAQQLGGSWRECFPQKYDVDDECS